MFVEKKPSTQKPTLCRKARSLKFRRRCPRTTLRSHLHPTSPSSNEEDQQLPSISPARGEREGEISRAEREREMVPLKLLSFPQPACGHYIVVSVSVSVVKVVVVDVRVRRSSFRRRRRIGKNFFPWWTRLCLSRSLLRAGDRKPGKCRPPSAPHSFSAALAKVNRRRWKAENSYEASLHPPSVKKDLRRDVYCDERGLPQKRDTKGRAKKRERRRERPASSVGLMVTNTGWKGHAFKVGSRAHFPSLIH